MSLWVNKQKPNTIQKLHQALKSLSKKVLLTSIAYIRVFKMQEAYDSRPKYTMA